jgi:hypothetical protein
MAPHKQYTTLQLITRGVLPSAVEGLACACFGIFFVAVHLFALSVNGSAASQLLGGRWASSYSNAVARPINAMLANPDFNTIMTIVLWGVVGVCVYFLLEYGLQLYRSWHEARTDIQLTGQTMILHATWRSFMTTVIWRLAMLLLLGTFLVVVQSLVTYLLANDPQLVLGSIAPAAGAVELVALITGWAFIAHCVVVFLRLFAMRTRLFGEVLY